MTKRVSIKGQGADIFFGEAGGRARDAQTSSGQETPREATQPASSSSRERKTDSKPARQITSHSESKVARQLSVLHDPLDEARKQRLLDLLS